MTARLAAAAFAARLRARPPLRPGARPRAREGGYAFLVVLGMAIVLALASQVVLQNLLTEGRRAREDEMIWRGNQYVRAIRMYYRKTGHYPQTVEDLKTGVGELHFLRYAAYKDPMNKGEDGAWRFIYVNSAGQIIGSVRYANLQQMALMELNGGKIPVGATLGSLGTPAANLASPPAGPGGTNLANSPSASAPGGASASSSSSSTDNSQGANTQSSSFGQSITPSQLSSSSDQQVNPLSLLKPTGPVDGPVLGGFLTGVGGGTQLDTPSIKVVSAGKKYKDWEFIWNPLEDQARAIQSGIGGLGQPQITQPPNSLAPPGSSSNFGNPGSMNPGFGGAMVPPSSPPQGQPQN